LKAILDAEAIMAKILAVDVAYHSHHIKAVPGHYLKLIQGLKTAVPRKSTQFFSAVTGELKTSGFGAEYWVEDLVSTVCFSDALSTSCREFPLIASSKAVHRVLLEVGPQYALAGPSKQILASGPNKLDFKYVSALIRGKDAYTTVLTLAGKLYEFGLDVNIEAVNGMDGGAKVRNMVLDLPPYAWDYSNRYWHESRLSREYRLRKYPYHELLGLRLVGSTPLEPIWRNILSVDAQPWLQEHIIDGFSILPGSSVLPMAMEAARHLNEERGAPKIKRFHLKKMNYLKAIVISDPPETVELTAGRGS
jgi:acyl transferase domain-containing protein